MRAGAFRGSIGLRTRAGPRFRVRASAFFVVVRGALAEFRFALAFGLAALFMFFAHIFISC
jgi:hypothetical protein